MSKKNYTFSCKTYLKISHISLSLFLSFIFIAQTQAFLGEDLGLNLYENIDT
jgi:small basic protein